jgi:hypothetical protein
MSPVGLCKITETENFGIIRRSSATPSISGKIIDTGIPFDNRFHKLHISGATGINDGVIELDGKIIDTGVFTYNGGVANYLEYTCASENTDARDVEVHVDISTVIDGKAHYLSSATGTRKIDLGTGKRAKQLIFTKEELNSTSVTVKARCASTESGLADATYETVTSETELTTKGQWVEIETTLTGAGSGEFTPLLKTLWVESEDSGESTETNLIMIDISATEQIIPLRIGSNVYV